MVASKTSDLLFLPIKTSYTQVISKFYHVTYELSSDYFEAYVTDEHTNSLLNSIPLDLDINHSHEIAVATTLREKKLGRPYNDCIQRLDESYREINCKVYY